MKWLVNFNALWSINHSSLLKYLRYYILYHNSYTFSNTKAYKKKHEYRLNRMCNFFRVFTILLSYMFVKNGTESWIMGRVCCPVLRVSLHPQTCISTQLLYFHTTQSSAKAKGPTIPVAEGLDPLFPGNIGVQENTSALWSTMSPQQEQILPFLWYVFLAAQHKQKYQKVGSKQPVYDNAFVFSDKANCSLLSKMPLRVL